MTSPQHKICAVKNPNRSQVRYECKGVNEATFQLQTFYTYNNNMDLQTILDVSNGPFMISDFRCVEVQRHHFRYKLHFSLNQLSNDLFNLY